MRRFSSQLPHGIETEDRFTVLFVYAGGTSDRFLLQVSFEVSDVLAERIRELEAELRAQIAARIDWSSAVSDKGGCKLVKASLDVTSTRVTTYRVAGPSLCSG